MFFKNCRATEEEEDYTGCAILQQLGHCRHYVEVVIWKPLLIYRQILNTWFYKAITVSLYLV
jgi:hypothetical protein